MKTAVFIKRSRARACWVVFLVTRLAAKNLNGCFVIGI